MPINLQTLKKMCESLKYDGGVYPLTLDNQTFWVKTVGEEKRNVIRVLSVLISKIKLFNFFQINSVLSSEERMLNEINIIDTLYKLDKPVPEIVLSEQKYFVTVDAGLRFSECELNKEQTKKHFSRVFDVLNEIHASGYVHGRPAIRDIIISTEGELKIIDFEEAQQTKNVQLIVRDIILLIIDSQRLNKLTQTDKVAMLNTWSKNSPSEYTTELKRLHRYMCYLKLISYPLLKIKQNRTSKQFLMAIDVFDAFFKTQASEHSH